MSHSNATNDSGSEQLDGVAAQMMRGADAAPDGTTGGGDAGAKPLPNPKSIIVETTSGKPSAVRDGETQLPFLTFEDAKDEQVKAGTVILLAGGGKQPYSARFVAVTTIVNEAIIGGLGRIATVVAQEAAPKNQTGGRTASGAGTRLPQRPTQRVPEIVVDKKGQGAPITFTDFGETQKDGAKVSARVKRQDHLKKHGEEFGLKPGENGEFSQKDNAEYMRLAKSFGRETGTGFSQVRIDKTTIRVDAAEPSERPDPNKRRVLIANGRELHTFYCWSPDFSSDPFVFAIYNTITNNKSCPIDELGNEKLQEYMKSGVDLKKMQVETIKRQIEAGDAMERIAGNNKVNEDCVRRLRDGAGGQQPDDRDNAVHDGFTFNPHGGVGDLGECFWDTLARLGIEEATLRQAADDAGVPYNGHMDFIERGDDDSVSTLIGTLNPLLEAAGQVPIQLVIHRFDLMRLTYKDSVLKGRGEKKVVIGFFEEGTAQGHFVPPRT